MEIKEENKQSVVSDEPTQKIKIESPIKIHISSENNKSSDLQGKSFLISSESNEQLNSLNREGTNKQPKS